MSTKFILRYFTIVSALLAVLLVSQQVSANDLVPTGTLRATYIATNPVQAFIDPNTKEVRGPGAEIAHALAKKLNVPLDIKGAPGVQGVLDSVKKGEADIGFLAYDPVRAVDVDFSQTYSLAQNTYIVLVNSPLRSIAETDRPESHRRGRARRRRFLPHPHAQKRHAGTQLRRQSRRCGQAAPIR